MAKRNTINLEELENAVKSGDELELTKDETISANQLIIIKRDGREEPYNVEKMRRVVQYATENEYLTEELLRDTEIKLYDRIKIVDLFDELIKTAASKISLLYPQWEYIAAKLYLMKIYKDVWQISDGATLPHLKEVLQKGVEHKVYDRKIIETFSDEEIDELNSVIDQKRDYLFTYKALVMFFEKYCMSYSKKRKLELPQFAYMRVSMFLHWKDDKSERVQNIIKTYNHLSKHEHTKATPIMLRSMTEKPQTASCVLTAIDDDTDSILDTVHALGVYSKYNGGTATDISRLRASGSFIKGNQGQSSGPVAFIKLIEQTMKAWAQGGSRPGANCIYFQWWHYDFDKLIVLKSNGGTDENRARGLKYAVKLNELYWKRVANDEEITLFDPKDVPDLFECWGEEFEKKYIEYEQKSHIRKRKMRARDHVFMLMKERTETGNIYIFDEENVNNQNMLGRYVNSSNLCVEILEPSRPSKKINERLIVDESGNRIIEKEYDAGEIALCNLASVNLLKWWEMSEEDRMEHIYDIVKAMDNTIDIAFYPVREGANSNKQYRYLGIGVNNYANLLASQGIYFDSQEAKEFTDEVFAKWSYAIIHASMRLAKERGAFPKFYETKWSQGILPVHLANENAKMLTESKWHDHEMWDELAEQVSQFGLRNALLMAVAPTATSGKSINATESIEPVVDLFYKEEGTINVTTLAPNFRQNNKYYKLAFSIDQRHIIELAAIRQKYIDQSQSVNLYVAKPDSLQELVKLHAYAHKLGIKTLYYMKQRKGDEEAICESCT